MNYVHVLLTHWPRPIFFFSQYSDIGRLISSDIVLNTSLWTHLIIEILEFYIAFDIIKKLSIGLFVILIRSHLNYPNEVFRRRGAELYKYNKK